MVKRITDNQVERLLDLVPYLTSKPGVSLEQVAKDFKTNKAGIIDDLNTLWMCGLPGYTPLELIDLSFDTGFVSIRNAEILSKPRKLTIHELAAVIVGLSILRESISPENSSYIPLQELISRLSASSKVPAPIKVVTAIAPEIRSSVEKAIREKSALDILYFSLAKDVESKRLITPIRFVVSDNHEYVESFCHSSDGYRMFRLDRISKVDIVDESLLPKLEHTLDNFEKISFAIKINFDSRKVSETFNLGVQFPVSLDHSFDCSAFNEEWIIRTICSLNDAASVKEPAALRAHIALRAQKALNTYL